MRLRLFVLVHLPATMHGRVLVQRAALCTSPSWHESACMVLDQRHYGADSTIDSWHRHTNTLRGVLVDIYLCRCWLADWSALSIVRSFVG